MGFGRTKLFSYKMSIANSRKINKEGSLSKEVKQVKKRIVCEPTTLLSEGKKKKTKCRLL